MPVADTSHVVDRELVRFYDKVFDWIVATGPRILAALIVLFLGHWLIRILRRKLTRAMSTRNVHSSLRPFLESLVFTALYVALAFLILQIIGIRLTMFAAVIAAFGAAVGLALSGTLQNFASGVLILLLKPFKVGDNIVAQGTEGTVSSIQIFYTVITAFDNKTVIMPNSKLSNEVIVNMTLQNTRRLDMELKFKHSVNFEQIKTVLNQTINSFTGVLKDPVFRIGITAMNKEDYTVICNIWLKAHGFEDARLLLNEKINAALHAAKIYDDK